MCIRELKRSFLPTRFPLKGKIIIFYKHFRVDMARLLVVLFAFVCAFEAAKYKYFIENVGDMAFVDAVYVVRSFLPLCFTMTSFYVTLLPFF